MCGAVGIECIQTLPVWWWTWQHQHEHERKHVHENSTAATDEACKKHPAATTEANTRPDNIHTAVPPLPQPHLYCPVFSSLRTTSSVIVPTM